MLILHTGLSNDLSCVKYSAINNLSAFIKNFDTQCLDTTVVCKIQVSDLSTIICIPFLGGDSFKSSKEGIAAGTAGGSSFVSFVSSTNLSGAGNGSSISSCSSSSNSPSSRSLSD
jgi:hypothetical protein